VTALLQHVLLAGLWGGLLALERRAFLQAMFSRPLVAATVTGMLLGDPSSGLFVGLVLELFFLGTVSLGGAAQELDTLPAVAAAAFAASLQHQSGVHGTPAVWALALLLCAPLSRVGRSFERRLDVRAQRYGDRARLFSNEGQLRRAVRQNLRAMWPHFVLFGLLCALSVLLGTLASPLFALLPLQLIRGLAWGYPALAAISAAVAVNASHARYALRYAAVSAALVLGITVAVLRLR
jgi:mannose/fructose/N-acetylgalactosamine-specific phosphotransferase system component IIC